MTKREEASLTQSDRSMDTDHKDGAQLFFFPKRAKPVSVRADTREEAERQLEEPNPQEV